MNNTWKLFFILSCFFLLASCNGDIPENTEPSQPESENDLELDQPLVTEEELTPLVMKENSFMRVIDWIDSERVLILSKGEDGNQLLEYNIFSGSQRIIYTNPKFIVDAQLGPDRKRVLVHAAPLTYSASATVIDLDGEVLFQKDIDSYEISFEWNEHNTDLLFITSFSEDWSFKTLLADILEGTLTEVKAPQPFLKWHLENSFLYQEWPEESISLTAPLYSQNLYSEERKLVEDETVHYDSMNPYILSITLSKEAEGEGKYKFVTEEGVIASTFSTPLLSSYSNWMIPYYDKIDTEDSFVSLTASESMPADAYNGKFTLERWDIQTGVREKVMAGLDNEPLQCSPGGDYCLTGYDLKTAIDLNNKEATDLIIIE
ncbi:hypothetical protein [Bacillus sp. SG-1]|uniref:YqgU-like beta propeller domain-containing protein n=1 Tax=Bacillus sp. SG-1 TaxID=161544 RepID=UPI0001544C21|nr:hypothetical protein [Bacillus sp. SG-1]EDL63551.1 YqgU [Bacillus sp. SG-1]